MTPSDDYSKEQIESVKASLLKLNGEEDLHRVEQYVAAIGMSIGAMMERNRVPNRLRCAIMCRIAGGIIAQNSSEIMVSGALAQRDRGEPVKGQEAMEEELAVLIRAHLLGVADAALEPIPALVLIIQKGVA